MHASIYFSGFGRSVEHFQTTATAKVKDSLMGFFYCSSLLTYLCLERERDHFICFFLLINQPLRDDETSSFDWFTIDAALVSMLIFSLILDDSKKK